MIIVDPPPTSGFGGLGNHDLNVSDFVTLLKSDDNMTPLDVVSPIHVLSQAPPHRVVPRSRAAGQKKSVDTSPLAGSSSHPTRRPAAHDIQLA